jgi:hypothetical protein
MNVKIQPTSPSLIRLKDKLKGANAKFSEGSIELNKRETPYVLFCLGTDFSIFINYKVYSSDSLSELKDYLVINIGLTTEDYENIGGIFTNEQLRFLLHPLADLD